MRRQTTKSLTKQIAAVIIALVAGIVLLCFILNSVFLTSFYSAKKQKQLLESFETINEACGDGILYSQSFEIPFESICTNNNIAIEIIGPDGRVMISSSGNAEDLKKQFFEIIFGLHTEETEILFSSDSYVLERTKDSRLQEEYLVLWGNLVDDNQILMRTPLEGIRESVEISNRFLMYVGAISIVVGILLVSVVTRRITKPILTLTALSERMAQLDFEAKYEKESNRRNEIDILGEHMNHMSEKLEMTISELKSANLELQKDIEQKNEIDEMRKDFLANVSHELKTPIALIQGYAEGLHECLHDDPESREFYCDVIVDEAGKMNEMVKKLLTLNQLEFGNDAVTMERFDLTELTAGVISTTGIMAVQNGVTIEFGQENPAYIWADEFKVEEVITNYLTNAIHHAGGEKKIRVFFTERGSLLRLSVFNTGKPVPREDLENIWIKFYKVDKAHTREYGGSGIGLSIVKAVMDSFGQACGVINHENGVEFWAEFDKNPVTHSHQTVKNENSNNFHIQKL